jgi:hypothetical protein
MKTQNHVSIDRSLLRSYGLRINFSIYRQVTPTEFLKPMFKPPTVGCFESAACYSHLNATIGSTLAARRAGM